MPTSAVDRVLFGTLRPHVPKTSESLYVWVVVCPQVNGVRCVRDLPGDTDGASTE